MLILVLTKIWLTALTGKLSETLFCGCVLLYVQVINLQIILLVIVLKFVHLILICLVRCQSRLVCIVAVLFRILGLKMLLDCVFRNVRLVVLLIILRKDVLLNAQFLSSPTETSLLIDAFFDALLILHSGLITKLKPVYPYALVTLMVPL